MSLSAEKESYRALIEEIISDTLDPIIKRKCIDITETHLASLKEEAHGEARNTLQAILHIRVKIEKYISTESHDALKEDLERFSKKLVASIFGILQHKKHAIQNPQTPSSDDPCGIISFLGTWLKRVKSTLGESNLDSAEKKDANKLIAQLESLLKEEPIATQELIDYSSQLINLIFASNNPPKSWRSLFVQILSLNIYQYTAKPTQDKILGAQAKNFFNTVKDKVDTKFDEILNMLSNIKEELDKKEQTVHFETAVANHPQSFFQQEDKSLLPVYPSMNLCPPSATHG